MVNLGPRSLSSNLSQAVERYDGYSVNPVAWGVLGVAAIATQRVIPAMAQSPSCNLLAVASREIEKSQAAARRFGFARAYGTYSELLADRDVEAVYIPLPNHLHMRWSEEALRSGKHVLCEKPIALNQAQTRTLIAARDATGLIVEEAFMARLHPQWNALRGLIEDGAIGQVRAVQCAYSYPLHDRDDIRLKAQYGGGAVYDIGCYAIAFARYVFNAEPVAVSATAIGDPVNGVDKLSSVILSFERGHATLTVTMDASKYQHATVLGSEGWIRADYPFAQAQPTRCNLFVGDASTVGGFEARQIAFAAVNQYTVQAERFSRLIRGEDLHTWPLEDALENMKVIDAVHRALLSGRQERVESI